MKKLIIIIALSVVLAAGGTVGTVLLIKRGKENVEEKYYYLTLVQTAGGTISYTLDYGEKDDKGKLKHGSEVVITATPNENFFCSDLLVNDVSVLSETSFVTKRITIKEDTRVKAIFRERLADTVFSRIGEAFKNTYPAFNEYADANGISGTIKMDLDYAGMTLPVDVNFSYAKDTADTFFGMDLIYGFTYEYELIPGFVIPIPLKLKLMSLYFFDAEAIDDAELYISIASLSAFEGLISGDVSSIDPSLIEAIVAGGDLPMDKYCTKPGMNIGMMREMIGEDGFDTGDQSMAYLMEEAGVIYDVENGLSYSSFAMDISKMANFMTGAEDGTQAELPGGIIVPEGMKIRVCMEFQTVGGVEKIKADAVTFEIETAESEPGAGDGVLILGNVKSMEFQSWTTPPVSTFNKEGAIEGELATIIASIGESIGTISDIIGSLAG